MKVDNAILAPQRRKCDEILVQANGRKWGRVQDLINIDPSIIFWKDPHMGNTTLLHSLCEINGWNNDLAKVLHLALENVRVQYVEKKEQEDNTEIGRCMLRNKGLFCIDDQDLTPLDLALDNGACLDDVYWYLTEEETDYFLQNVDHFPPLFARWCDDMSLLEDLLIRKPGIILSRPNSLSVTASEKEQKSSLYYACQFQNAAMLQTTLQYCQSIYHETWTDLRRRLTFRGYDEDRISPLGVLILAVGNMDPSIAKECLAVCLKFVPKHLVSQPLDLFFNEIFQPSVWETLMIEGRCFKTIERIMLVVKDGQIQLNDETIAKTLSEAFPTTIVRIAVWQEWPEASRVLTFLLNAILLTTQNECDMILEACRAGLLWHNGLNDIVKYFPEGLYTHDRNNTQLLPYQLRSTIWRVPVRRKDTSKAVERPQKATDVLGTIYELLRSNPGII